MHNVVNSQSQSEITKGVQDLDLDKLSQSDCSPPTPLLTPIAAATSTNTNWTIKMRPFSDTSVFVPCLEEAVDFLKGKKRDYREFTESVSEEEESRDSSVEYVRLLRPRRESPSERKRYYPKDAYPAPNDRWPSIPPSPQCFDFPVISYSAGYSRQSIVNPSYQSSVAHTLLDRAPAEASWVRGRRPTYPVKKRQRRERSPIQHPIIDDSDDVPTKTALINGIFAQDIVHQCTNQNEDRLSVFLKEDRHGHPQPKRPLNIYFMFRMDIPVLVDRFARLHKAPILVNSDLFLLLKKCCTLIPLFKEGLYAGNAKTAACTRRWEDLKRDQPEEVRYFEALEVEMKELYAAPHNFLN
ncbi:hypothetical protein BT69DRAFT_1353509 [Atractiella rhizophila]|nr:hypothetical protein BT69DRAFT_1353509 [Atractiella rhizophila]